MTPEEFEQLVAEEFNKAIPERFHKHIQNVALLVEDEPSQDIRKQEGLQGGETLLGLYQGISLNRRGVFYGTGPTMPDTITLFRLPIVAEAQSRGGTEEILRQIIRDTVWHEVAHYFGFSERSVNEREDSGTNTSA